jgi:D-inositol-3-phosphate glycosyltransferase
MVMGRPGRVPHPAVAVSISGTRPEGWWRVLRRLSDAASRVAMLSMHTSPLDQAGTGDAGGMNVYVVELAKRLAARGTEVEIFTRAARGDATPRVELAPGVQVRHVTAGPYEVLDKEDLPAQLCAFFSGVMRAEAQHEPGYYDLVHSHYWLSGQVGWLAAERWGVPHVHHAHTLGKVKNAALATGDRPEPRGRLLGEEQVVAVADRLIASTDREARELVELYGADPERIATVAPGVDLSVFQPGDPGQARTRIGVPPDALLVLFVGRLQPLKAPDVVIRAAARLLARRPDLRDRLRVAVVGGPSGSGFDQPARLAALVDELDLTGLVQFAPPVAQARLADYYRAATAVVVPSHNESFGLVALEAQACGTPVVAARVGGLRIAVDDGRTGFLIDGHDPGDYADALARLLDDPRRVRTLGAMAVAHAARFGWEATADGISGVYADALAERARRGEGEPARLVVAR